MSIPFSEFEKRWQGEWEKAGCFKASAKSDKPKYYALDMFPYPSGKGLHVGHLASYTPTDIVSRYKRAKGFNVLHPMGYDAFGLPAEQYAIQTGVHPRETTEAAIANFRRQLKSFGYSFDWSRELSTCEPEFYKWTQKIMTILFERGLAYQKEAPVNWCPELRTVLANEEVVDGKSERGGHPVIRVKMKQWMLKITEYAERLLNDLDDLDWPSATKEAQRNWIGKSEGARVLFKIESIDQSLEVFTTRPDTLFGATFMVLAPEHPVVSLIATKDQKAEVDKYVDQAARKSDVDRKADTKKTGVPTGAFAINPVNGEKIPIWIADYVLMDYGTGAIMAVPGHDDRDFEFAETFNLPVKRVLESKDDLPYMGDGKLVNSDFLDGLDKKTAIKKITEFLEEKKLGEKKVQYKLRDWLFSRQRYWGEPFPFVHYEDGRIEAIPDEELPVVLPDVVDYQPTEKGEPPLARVPEWVNYTHKKTGEKGKRDTDTMPGWAGSSWYFLRYTDPDNKSEIISKEAEKYWFPIDLYVGGGEHSVLHLLYARFWHKVLFDAGYVSTKEPIYKLRHQGVVMGPDGQRMSKSRGNVINPDNVSAEYGADICRLYITFMGPFEKNKPWDPKGIEGVNRFLDRVWRLCFDGENNVIAGDETEVSKDLLRQYHKTIKKVGHDIEALSINTAVSAMMILVNEIYKQDLRPKFMLKTLAQLLQPFAPHTAEEIWSRLGGEGLVAVAPWPEFDPSLIVDDIVTLGVQVNGKMRGTIELSPDSEEAEAVSLAKTLKTVQNAIDGKNLVKVIYRQGKILNLIAK